MSILILLADKKLRTKTLYCTAFLVVLGLMGILYLLSSLDQLTALQVLDPQFTAERYSRLLFVFGIANALIASGAGGGLGLIFYRALKAERFPPPGIRLLWDTRLRTGQEARRIALAGLAVAIAIAVGGIGVGAVMISISRTPIFSGSFLQALLAYRIHFFS